MKAPTNSPPIRLDSGVRVLHFDVLMPHQCPSAQIRPIQVRRALEVLDRLLVLRPQRIVVAHETAYLRSVLVDGEKIVRKFRELKAVFGHIKDV